MSYAAIKGRAPTQQADAPAPVVARAQDLPVLNDTERAAIAERKRLCEQYAPAFAAFIREAYALGLIEGWRALERVEIIGDQT